MIHEVTDGSFIWVAEKWTLKCLMTSILVKLSVFYHVQSQFQEDVTLLSLSNFFNGHLKKKGHFATFYEYETLSVPLFLIIYTCTQICLQLVCEY